MIQKLKKNKPKIKSKIKTESSLQSQAVKYYSILRPQFKGRLIGINNNSANKIKGFQNKKMGVLSGVSDMILLLDNMQVVWIEWKTKIGKQSAAQIEFENKLISIGHKYHLVRSIPEFISVLDLYSENINNNK